MWKEDSQAVNEAREKKLVGQFFKPALDRGAQMVRHHNTIESAHDILRRIVKNQPVVLQIQRELVDECKDLIDTAAGQSISQELKEQIRRHQKELKDLREEMIVALKSKDEELRRELEDAKKELEEKVERIKRVLELMVVNYIAEKEKMTTKRREMEQERKQTEAGYDRKLTALRDKLQYTPTASADDREGWEQEIKKLQDRITIPIYE